MDIEINGEPVELQMKLGDAGEAFFVEEVENDLSDSLCTSPLRPSSERLEDIKKDHDASHEVNFRQLIPLIIQLYQLLYRKCTKQVQISHNIVQVVIVQYRAHAHSVTLVVFFQVIEKG